MKQFFKWLFIFLTFLASEVYIFPVFICRFWICIISIVTIFNFPLFFLIMVKTASQIFNAALACTAPTQHPTKTSTSIHSFHSPRDLPPVLIYQGISGWLLSNKNWLNFIVAMRMPANIKFSLPLIILWWISNSTGFGLAIEWVSFLSFRFISFNVQSNCV